MSHAHFMRIDREGNDGEKHYVVHTQRPHFAVELTPDRDAPDQVGAGVIKRVCVPNSWAGDYGQYGKLLTQAQRFFAEAGPLGRPRH